MCAFLHKLSVILWKNTELDGCLQCVNCRDECDHITKHSYNNRDQLREYSQETESPNCYNQNQQLKSGCRVWHISKCNGQKDFEYFQNN